MAAADAAIMEASEALVKGRERQGGFAVAPTKCASGASVEAARYAQDTRGRMLELTSLAESSSATTQEVAASTQQTAATAGALGASAARLDHAADARRLAPARLGAGVGWLRPARVS